MHFWWDLRTSLLGRFSDDEIEMGLPDVGSYAGALIGVQDLEVVLDAEV